MANTTLELNSLNVRWQLASLQSHWVVLNFCMLYLRVTDMYPSVSTVVQKYCIPHIIPSVSVPTQQEISDNIKMFFGTMGKLKLKSTSPLQSQPGHILMIDGVALNEVCHYYADRNC